MPNSIMHCLVAHVHDTTIIAWWVTKERGVLSSQLNPSNAKLCICLCHLLLCQPLIRLYTSWKHVLVLSTSKCIQLWNVLLQMHAEVLI